MMRELKFSRESRIWRELRQRIKKQKRTPKICVVSLDTTSNKAPDISKYQKRICFSVPHLRFIHRRNVDSVVLVILHLPKSEVKRFGIDFYFSSGFSPPSLSTCDGWRWLWTRTYIHIYIPSAFERVIKRTVKMAKVEMQRKGKERIDSVDWYLETFKDFSYLSFLFLVLLFNPSPTSLSNISTTFYFSSLVNRNRSRSRSSGDHLRRERLDEFTPGKLRFLWSGNTCRQIIMELKRENVGWFHVNHVIM